MIALLIVRLAAGYLALGSVFALWFAWRGAGRLDPAARGGSMGFRLLVLPGAALLWPVLLRAIRAGGAAPPEEANAHRPSPSRSAVS